MNSQEQHVLKVTNKSIKEWYRSEVFINEV